jgi:two-component system phosphate regulon response regulator PhoB
MLMQTVLIVDDEAAIREMLRFNLTRNGFHTLEAANTHQARQSIKKHHPDLVLLDIMLPDQSGTDLARELRNTPATRDIPIIMLTAKDAEQDKIKGLDVGADDYITKPFSPAELIARINSLLRRVNIDKQSYHESLDAQQFLDLRLNLETHEVLFKQQKIELSPLEFKLLSFLISKPERVFSRSQLLDFVWGKESFIEERTVDVHIRRLRQSLETTGYDSLIQTVRGVGYRLSGKFIKS